MIHITWHVNFILGSLIPHPHHPQAPAPVKFESCCGWHVLTLSLCS